EVKVISQGPSSRSEAVCKLDAVRKAILWNGVLPVLRTSRIRILLVEKIVQPDGEVEIGNAGPRNKIHVGERNGVECVPGERETRPDHEQFTPGARAERKRKQERESPEML